MDVIVIFQNPVSVDDKRNFLVNFKDEEKIINVLLNRKKDYFITNAIIYINEIKDKKNNGQKKDSDIEKIKNLEKEAEKYIVMVKSKKFKTIVSKNFSLSYNKDFYVKIFKPEYNFKFDEKEMENFLTSYKYYNIKNKKIEYFKAYDLLKHLRYGLIYKYDLNAKKGWYSPPIDQITFKISENEKNIEVSCQKTKNKTYINYLYSWANRLVVIDTLNLKLISSLTGCRFLEEF